MRDDMAAGCLSREVVWGWVKVVMRMKEGTCHDEHWVTHGRVGSLHGTPGINITLYTNWNFFKILFI